jgi:hypothetical protein
MEMDDTKRNKKLHAELEMYAFFVRYFWPYISVTIIIAVYILFVTIFLLTYRLSQRRICYVQLKMFAMSPCVYQTYKQYFMSDV